LFVILCTIICLSLLGLMSPVHAARNPRAVRLTDDSVNLFLLPSMALVDTADRSNPESGISVVLNWSPFYICLHIVEVFSKIILLSFSPNCQKDLCFG